MKLNKILFAMTLAAAFTACQQEKALENPLIATESASYEMPADGGEISVTFTSNMTWEVQVTPGNSKSEVADIKVTPSYGEASQRPITVTVKAKANPDKKRVAVISIIGNYAKAAFKVSQAGQADGAVEKGTLATPYKASELFDYLKGGDTPDAEVYVTGIVSKMGSYSENYGSQTYYITDDGTEGDKTLQIYGGHQFGGEKFPANQTIVKVGDQVVVKGKAKLYSGSPEVDANNVLISVNGKVPSAGDGSLASPFNVTKAIELVQTEKQPSTEVYVKGFISQIDNDGAVSKYGDMQYWISDDGTTTHQMEVYQGLYLNGAAFTEEGQIKLGDEVIINGKLTSYKGIIEFAAKSQIVSLNGRTE